MSKPKQYRKYVDSSVHVYKTVLCYCKLCAILYTRIKEFSSSTRKFALQFRTARLLLQPSIRSWVQECDLNLTSVNKKLVQMVRIKNRCRWSGWGHSLQSSLLFTRAKSGNKVIDRGALLLWPMTTAGGNHALRTDCCVRGFKHPPSLPRSRLYCTVRQDVCLEFYQYA